MRGQADPAAVRECGPEAETRGELGTDVSAPHVGDDRQRLAARTKPTPPRAALAPPGGEEPGYWLAGSIPTGWTGTSIPGRQAGLGQYPIHQKTSGLP